MVRVPTYLTWWISKLGPQNKKGVCYSSSRTVRVGSSCPVLPSGSRERSVCVLGNTNAVLFLGWRCGGSCFAFHL